MPLQHAKQLNKGLLRFLAPKYPHAGQHSTLVIRLPNTKCGALNMMVAYSPAAQRSAAGTA